MYNAYYNTNKFCTYRENILYPWIYNTKHKSQVLKSYNIRLIILIKIGQKYVSLCADPYLIQPLF